MGSRTEETSSRHPKRVRVETLERYADALLKRTGRPRPALLSVSLSRSDRMRALVRRPDTLVVLASVLDRLEASLLPIDRYAVVSVTEIWVLVAEAPAESIVRLAATALRERVDDFYPGRFDDGTESRVQVSAAIGASWVDDSDVTFADMVSATGRAYAEARRNEDRIVVLRAGDDLRKMRPRLEARVRAALAANSLEVWYQPQVALRDLTCPSLEALVRWPAADAPTIDPATLVSICEESGMISELTRFLVNTALRNMMVWSAQGIEPAIGINLSAITLSDANFPTQVAQACETWGVPPSRLLFELTEGSIANNEKTTIEFMHRLRELGCELSIDDFGTGYSSFAYLRHFPVNELKIDRAFVRELTTQAADRRIVKVLIEIAHVFGLRALAEGVEDAQTLKILSELGCDAVQGWYFSKALPGHDVPTWVTRFTAQQARLAETIEPD
jgi:EAL domain-containing protein (putative c-di-GMP-specific phosphodiesterase class I)